MLSGELHRGGDPALGSGRQVSGCSKRLAGLILHLGAIAGILGESQDGVVGRGRRGRIAGGQVRLRLAFQQAGLGEAVAHDLRGAAVRCGGALRIAEGEIGARNARLHRLAQPRVGFEKLPVGGDGVGVAAQPHEGLGAEELLLLGELVCVTCGLYFGGEPVEGGQRLPVQAIGQVGAAEVEARFRLQGRLRPGSSRISLNRVRAAA